MYFQTTYPSRRFTPNHRLLETLFDECKSPASDVWSPSSELLEKEKAFTILMDLPGVSEETLKINLETNILTIEGERQKYELNDTETRLFSERNYGKFIRTFQLSEHIDKDLITADFKNGQLFITLPKTEQTKPKQINITINSNKIQ